MRARRRVVFGFLHVLCIDNVSDRPPRFELLTIGRYCWLEWAGIVTFLPLTFSFRRWFLQADATIVEYGSPHTPNMHRSTTDKINRCLVNQPTPHSLWAPPWRRKFCECDTQFSGCQHSVTPSLSNYSAMRSVGDCPCRLSLVVIVVFARVLKAGCLPFTRPWRSRRLCCSWLLCFHVENGVFVSYGDIKVLCWTGWDAPPESCQWIKAVNNCTSTPRSPLLNSSLTDESVFNVSFQSRAIAK